MIYSDKYIIEFHQSFEFPASTSFTKIPINIQLKPLPEKQHFAVITFIIIQLSFLLYLIIIIIKCYAFVVIINIDNKSIHIAF